MTYNVNHKDFSFEFNVPEHLAGTYSVAKVRKLPLNRLKAKLVVSMEGTNVKHDLFDLDKTPHYAFLKGQKEAYKTYLEKFTWAVGVEHSEENFQNLINNFGTYLQLTHNKDYIICQAERGHFVIRDGLHRATMLLTKGYKDIPVVVLNDFNDQLDSYAYDYKDTFLEWYTPVVINDENIFHERTYPNFVERPEYMTNKERGESKWKYIIEKNMPDLRGKTVCDVGCNIGLYAYYMTKMGAVKVDGYDRSSEIIQPSNPNLPRQSVVQQAYFVKNLLQLRDDQKYDNLNFYEFDINLANFESFKYDVFYSSCVLYHFGEKFDGFIEQISKNNPTVVLQTNLGHGGPLGEYASVDYHKHLLEKYGYSVEVDAPIGYKYPMIIGKR